MYDLAAYMRQNLAAAWLAVAACTRLFLFRAAGAGNDRK